MGKKEKEQVLAAEEQAAQAAEAQAAEAETPEEPAQPDELTELREQNAALNDKLLRLMAEYDNYKKRTQREKDAIFPEATAAAIASFLPVIDDFERAMGTECADEGFKEGVAMIQRTLLGIFEKYAVEAIGAPGEPFDPQLHNAVMHIEDESMGEGVVAQVFQKGYRIGDRVLRYAMVQVAN